MFFWFIFHNFSLICLSFIPTAGILVQAIMDSCLNYYIFNWFPNLWLIPFQFILHMLPVDLSYWNVAFLTLINLEV